MAGGEALSGGVMDLSARHQFSPGLRSLTKILRGDRPAPFTPPSTPPSTSGVAGAGRLRRIVSAEIVLVAFLVFKIYPGFTHLFVQRIRKGGTRQLTARTTTNNNNNERWRQRRHIEQGKVVWCGGEGEEVGIFSFK